MPTETPRGRTVEPLASAPAVEPEGRTSAPPSLSVILPSYNHGQWLPRSLGALVAQAGPSIEIVLIDDGSTDNSAAVIADFCRRHDCIRLIRHDANRGPLAAVRDRHRRRARGSFCCLQPPTTSSFRDCLRARKRHCATIPTLPSFVPKSRWSTAHAKWSDTAPSSLPASPAVTCHRLPCGAKSSARTTGSSVRASSIGAGCSPRSAISTSRSARSATAWRSGCWLSTTGSISLPRYSRCGWSIRKAFRPRRRCR